MIDYIGLIQNLGFPIFVACILLWDKIKTNGSLLRVVENNNEILVQIKEKFK